MSARTAIVESLIATLARWQRDEASRLLQITIDPSARRSIVAMVMAHEHRPDNRRPFVLLDADHTMVEAGWRARAGTARAAHEQRRSGAEARVPALPPPPSNPDDRTGFAMQVQQLLAASPEHASGLCVVLAPGALDATARWRESIAMLVDRGELATVRWIVIEPVIDGVLPWVATQGPRARAFDARLPAGEADKELDRLVTGAPPAMPRGVEPPSRPDVPVRKPDADGLRRTEIGRLSLAASLASARGRGAEAVVHARGARDLAQQAKWTNEALTLELALGGHLVAAGAARDAETVFASTIAQATALGMLDKATTAGFGLAATRTIRKERHTALVAYADAATTAERSNSPVLAIEANRLAGQAALDVAMEPQAIAFFSKAVALAERPDAPVPSSGPLAARTLAGLCRKRGLATRAAELEASALQMEQRVPSDGAASIGAASAVSPAVAAPAASPPVAAPPIAAPPIGASPAAPPSIAIGEGTGMLTLDQIARLHLHGVAADPTPPAQGARGWTRDEIDSLQRAVDHAINDDASRILTPEELAALRGQAVLSDEQARNRPGGST